MRTRVQSQIWRLIKIEIAFLVLFARGFFQAVAFRHGIETTPVFVVVSAYPRFFARTFVKHGLAEAKSVALLLRKFFALRHFRPIPPTMIFVRANPRFQIRLFFKINLASFEKPT